VSIRAVVFDLDNTLILEDDSVERALEAAAELAHARLGVDTRALARAAREAAARRWQAAPESKFGDAFGIWWGEVMWGEFSGDAPPLRAIRAVTPSLRRAVWVDALAKLGKMDDALADEMAAEYVRARCAAETLDPEAEPVLRALASRYPLALLTNGASDVQRAKLARTPFAAHFAEVVISVEAGVGKPDPEIFLLAARRLGVDARDCVMVGDSLARDVEGAKAAGMRTVWIDRKLWDERETAKPDARIERLSDLPAALDALAPASASRRARS
jgi:putative hydrolase of the HAD superfamily